jgi:alkanesulfonate monooxygenase SsuD/methylene tetrahydromethanopterin reductase-like flavin-dependent oxidoreductase (luciferase family)
MRIGVFLVAARFPWMSPGEVLRNTVEAIVAAERAGFDDAWIAEHHFMSYGVCPSATTLAAVALGRTSRITVGTAVSVLSTQHPVALAEQAAILDHVSGGRFRLGVGRGGPWVDLEVFGTGLTRFEYGFRESLDVLCAALKDDVVSADGDFFRFREVPMVPATRMSPVVACTSSGTVALAAERGLPMLLGMHIADEEKAAMVAEYESARRAEPGPAREHAPGGRAPEHVVAGGHAPGGRDPGHISRPAGEHTPGGRDPGHVSRPAGEHTPGGRDPGHVAAAVGHVADSTAQAVKEMKDAMPRWLEPGLAGYMAVDDRPRPQRNIEKYVDMLCGIHPVGSPEHCIEVLRATAERTGLQHVILMVEGTGEHARTLENIARLGSEVLPALRDPGPSRSR